MWHHAPGTSAIHRHAEQTISWKHEQHDPQFSWHVSASHAPSPLTSQSLCLECPSLHLPFAWMLLLIFVYQMKYYSFRKAFLTTPDYISFPP